MGIGVGWVASVPPAHCSAAKKPLDEARMGRKGSLQGEKKETGALLQFVFLCSHGCECTHKHTHTHQPREGGRAGLRSRGGRARKGETKEVGGHTHRLSLSCPLSHNPGAPAGTGREGTS